MPAGADTTCGQREVTGRIDPKPEPAKPAAAADQLRLSKAEPGKPAAPVPGTLGDPRLIRALRAAGFKPEQFGDQGVAAHRPDGEPDERGEVHERRQGVDHRAGGHLPLEVGVGVAGVDRARPPLEDENVGPVGVGPVGVGYGGLAHQTSLAVTGPG